MSTQCEDYFGPICIHQTPMHLYSLEDMSQSHRGQHFHPHIYCRSFVKSDKWRRVIKSHMLIPVHHRLIVSTAGMVQMLDAERLQITCRQRRPELELHPLIPKRPTTTLTFQKTILQPAADVTSRFCIFSTSCLRHCWGMSHHHDPLFSRSSSRCLFSLPVVSPSLHLYINSSPFNIAPSLYRLPFPSFTPVQPLLISVPFVCQTRIC